MKEWSLVGLWDKEGIGGQEWLLQRSLSGFIKRPNSEREIGDPYMEKIKET